MDERVTGMALKKIRLELARDAGFPNGSAEHGYEFTAPLDAQGHIDAEGWRRGRKHCRVRRFWAGEDDELGHLARTRGGTWTFRYDISGDPDEDEAGFKFDAHRFAEGEYVSLREQDGEMRTFRVISVKPVVAVVE